MLCQNILHKNGKTPPKVDSDQDPKKHHTIRADVFQSDIEDLLSDHNFVILVYAKGFKS